MRKLDKHIIVAIAGKKEAEAVLLRLQGYSFARIGEMTGVTKMGALLRVRRGRARLAAAKLPMRFD